MALKDHILKLADGVSKCQENAKSLAQVIFRGLDDIADNLPEHPGGGSTVDVTQVLSSGTKIATITVDDTPTDLYAPTPTAPTDVDVTQVVSTGTKIATITVDDVPTDLYAPTPTAPIHTYSNEEKAVGVWVNGKTIYERTWTFESEFIASYNSWSSTTIDSTNMDCIISVLASHSDGTGYSGIMADPTSDNHTVVGLQTTRNGANSLIKYLTLQYTKIS